MIMWIMKLTTHYRLDITHSYNTKVHMAQQLDGQNFLSDFVRGTNDTHTIMVEI